MMKKILAALAFFGSICITVAQQTPTFDHYLVNQYLVNPAAAGMNGTNVIIDYRRQWTGFAGAPETQVLSIDGAIKKDKIGLGLMVVNDQVNILGSTGAFATFAYRAKFSENHFLRLGVSAGINQNRILFDKINADDPSELILFQNNQNATSFDGAAGLFYELGKLKVGISSMHLFGGRYYYENNFDSQSLNYQTINHYLVNAEYRFDIKKGKWGIVPFAQAKTAQGLKPLLEGGITGFYKKNVWLTLRYMDKVGYSVSFGGFIAKNIIAGYAYTYSTSEIGAYNQGSHDIILGFRFGSKNGGNGADQKAMDDLRKNNSELFETTDFLKNQNDQLKKDIELQKKALKETIYGLDSIKNLMRKNKDELDKIIQENLIKFEKYQNNSGTVNTNAKDKTDNNNDSGSNKSDKKTSDGGDKNDGGDSTKENNSSLSNSEEVILDGKIYVVIGASVSLDVTKQFQKMVLREYGEETKIVRGEGSVWYFVYTKSFENTNDAAKEQNRMAKMDEKSLFIGIPWCLIQNK
jgi:type IX secretion system PorP/SprF family membrane protein